MSILDFFKATFNALMGDDEYENENDSLSKPKREHKHSDMEDFESIEDTNEDNFEDKDDNEFEDEDEDDDSGLSEEEMMVLESALRSFYSRLSEKELEDPDIDKIVNEVQDLYIDNKIDNPEKALNEAYTRWKSTKKERNQKRCNRGKAIVDLLRQYDTLTKEEKEQLTDYESPLYLGNLTKADSKSVEEIVQSWLDSKSIDDEKCELMNLMAGSKAEEWVPYIEISNVPLSEADYKQLLALFKYNYTPKFHYKEMSDYIKRYWLESGYKPQQVECDDLIVNRPCYMATELELCTPHFHLGKRYFDEDDCFQIVKVYLFADKLEYICDGGHIEIALSDIIDIKINDWSYIEMGWADINHWREVEKGRYGDATNSKPCPETPEPELLEITCRNNRKCLFTYRDYDSELLVLRGLLFYFIKIAK